MKHEIAQKDYAQLCNAVKREAPERQIVPFSSEEIYLLCENVEEIPFADMILIGIYSGWRPQELVILKTPTLTWKQEP